MSELDKFRLNGISYDFVGSSGDGDEVVINGSTTDATKILIDTSDPVTYQIPEINDDDPSSQDTYSSYKIETLMSELSTEAGLQGRYTNPVCIGVDNAGLPDPCAAQDGVFFYVFTSHPRIHIHKSTNLVDWVECSDAITDDDYATLGVLNNSQSPLSWAPCVIKHNNLWMMYVTSRTAVNNTHMCVFTSDNPEGPWKYRGEITNNTVLGVNDCIDADVIRDSDGKLYMFLGAEYGIYLIKLSDDGLSMDTSFDKVLIHPHTPSDSNNIKLEGAECFWRNGYYYLFASCGYFTKGGGYHVVVARSTSIQGPFLNQNGDSIVISTNVGTKILEGTSSLSDPGHNANLLLDKKGNYWMLFHAYPSDSNIRQLCLQRLYWDESTGWPYFESGKVKSADDIPRF